VKKYYVNLEKDHTAASAGFRHVKKYYVNLEKDHTAASTGFRHVRSCSCLQISGLFDILYLLPFFFSC